MRAIYGVRERPRGGRRGAVRTGRDCGYVAQTTLRSVKLAFRKDGVMASARILLTLAVLHLTAAQPLLAEPITINFGGVITTQFHSPLPPSWPIGTPVTGSFTYDPAAGEPSSGIIDYFIPAVANGSIGADPFGPNAVLRFIDDSEFASFGPSIGFGDHVVLTVYSIPGLSQPGCGIFTPVCLAGLQMDLYLAFDPTGTLISDPTAPPLDPLPLSTGNPLILWFHQRNNMAEIEG